MRKIHVLRVFKYGWPGNLFRCMKLLRFDEQEFEAFFREHYPGMVKYCIRIVGQPHIAEEIVSSIFTTIWERNGKIRIRHSLEHYLMRSVRNNAINYLKSQYKRLTDLDTTDEEKESELYQASDLMAEQDLVVAVNQSLEKMPAKTSLIFRMSRFGGQTHKEIAEELSLGVKSIEYHINAAIKNLRRDLRDFL